MIRLDNESGRIEMKGSTQQLTAETTAVMAGMYSILKKDFGEEDANRIMTASLFMAVDNNTQTKLDKCLATSKDD